MWQSSSARILMSSEQRMPDLEPLASLIKVLPHASRQSSSCEQKQHY